MAPADFCMSLPTPCDASSTEVTLGTHADLPGYCAHTFTLMPVGFTPHRSVQVLGFDNMGRLTPVRRLYPLPVRQASALPSASSRFAVTRDTLAVRLTLPLAGRVGDFHPQVPAPLAGAPKKRQGRKPLPSSAPEPQGTTSSTLTLSGSSPADTWAEPWSRRPLRCRTSRLFGLWERWYRDLTARCRHCRQKVL